MTFTEWLERYEREESERRIFARCTCGDEICDGWVLTWRDGIYPYETPLTPEERAAWGVPDPFPDIPLFSLMGEPIT